MVITVFGETKRVMSSTWPCVSSPAMPLSSQMTGGAVHGRVALLRGREQAFFGGDERAAAVDVDRSAFEHDAVLVFRGLAEGINDERMHDAYASSLRHPLADFCVEFVIRILGPGVELKV